MMTCAKARALLLGPEADRRQSPENGVVARHLAECADCRAVFADTQIVGELLRQWPDVSSSAVARVACVGAMGDAWADGRRRPSRLGWVPRIALRPASLAAALVVCATLVVLWPPPPSADPVAAMRGALEGVDAWYANGTITPALIPQGGRPTNRVEVWFRKPDAMFAALDGEMIQLLQKGHTRTWHFGTLNRTVVEETNALDFTQLFSVTDWLAHESVLASPTRVIGEDWFGRQRVKQIEIRIAEGHPTTARDLGVDSVRLDANVDSMLPVHIEARG